MVKKSVAIIMVFSMLLMTACGKEADPVAEVTVTEETSSVEEIKDIPTEAASSDASEDDLSQIKAAGDVEVDKGLFNVELTIPAEFVGDVTQEKLDESVAEKGYKSATLNEDGSVTYVMTKSQHEELVKVIEGEINDGMKGMIGSEDYPDITDVTANSDYTSFAITTKNAEPNMNETLSVMIYYMYGGMYAVFNGEKAENIHVDFVNADSGEVISSADSKNMGK